MREETVITLPIPEVALWGLLGFALAVFLTVSAVVHHHWGYYGLKDSDRTLAAGVYYTVSGVLLAGMALAALAYSTF